MKSHIIRLAIAFAAIVLLPMAFCGTIPQNTGEISDLVKGLAIITHKSKAQPSTLVVRIENHTAYRVSLLPDAILHPNVTISVASADGNSGQVFVASRDLGGEEELGSAKKSKHAQILIPGKSIEISLKIADLIDRCDSAAKAAINQAPGRVKIGLSFDNLIIGVGGNENPVEAYNTTFEAPECDLPKWIGLCQHKRNCQNVFQFQ
jgi:hypothetical protein